MSKVTLELNLKRDRLVNDENTEPVRSQEPHGQSATELVRARHCEGARRRYPDHHWEKSAQHHLFTPVLISMYVITKVSTHNHKVSSSKIMKQCKPKKFFYKSGKASPKRKSAASQTWGKTSSKPPG